MRRPARRHPAELARSRDGDERGNVTRPDGGEVPQVHRRDNHDPEPLAESHYRSIRATEPQVGVLAYEADIRRRSESASSTSWNVQSGPVPTLSRKAARQGTPWPGS